MPNYSELTLEQKARNVIDILLSNVGWQVVKQRQYNNYRQKTSIDSLFKQITYLKNNMTFTTLKKFGFLKLNY